MQYKKLGKTDLEVSLIGLGTMTWGEQNTLEEACEQMDYAFSRGVNFIDVAEMYPVPPRPETQGSTESYVGEWLTHTGTRSEIILATISRWIMFIATLAEIVGPSLRPMHLVKVHIIGL